MPISLKNCFRINGIIYLEQFLEHDKYNDDDDDDDVTSLGISC